MSPVVESNKLTKASLILKQDIITLGLQKKIKPNMNAAMMRKLTAMIRDDPNDPWAREHTLSGRHEHVNYKLRLNYNMTWIKGRRPRQEDSHLAIRINAHISLFGVFDGHGGAKVSNRVSFLFPEVFKREIVEIKTKDYSADNLAAALRRSFAKTDEALLKEVPVKKSPGSTAAIVLLHRNFIICAHCGDSKIHLYKNEGHELFYESLDHRPSEEKEAQRICSNGGCVYKNRISSPRCKLGLAVSRSFGDFEYKKMADPENQNPEILDLVSCEPDIEVFDLTNPASLKLKAVLICCDGVTDVLKAGDIRQNYVDNKGDSGAIVRQAFASKSLDNISACCINIE